MASGAKESTGESSSAAGAEMLRASVGSECPICLGAVRRPAFVAYCMHQFCFSCIRHWAQAREECPVCRQSLEQVLHSVRGDDDYKLFVVGLPTRLRRRMAIERARGCRGHGCYNLRRRLAADLAAASPREPIAHRSEPVVGRSEPMAGQSEPMARRSEPVVGRSEPMAGRSGPMARRRERMAGRREPMAGRREPMADQRERMAGRRDPMAGRREPMADQREPMAGRREPMADQRELMADQRELMAGRRETMAGQREPMSGQREPMVGQREPTAGWREPMADQREPMGGRRETMAGRRETMAGQREPMAGQSEPVDTESSQAQGAAPGPSRMPAQPAPATSTSQEPSHRTGPGALPDTENGTEWLGVLCGFQ